MATYAVSIKPYLIQNKARATWRVLLRRTSAQAGAGLRRLGRRLSTSAPWYDESEHGNRLVMWS